MWFEDVCSLVRSGYFSNKQSKGTLVESLKELYSQCISFHVKTRGFTREDLKYVTQIMNKVPRLMYFSCKGISVCPEKDCHITEFCAGPDISKSHNIPTKLKRLTLKSCKPSNLRNLHSNQLRHFEVTCCDFEKGETQDLVQHLRMCTLLESLHFSLNSIVDLSASDSLCKSVCSAISSKRLQHIDLSEMQMQNEDAIALSNNTLRQLDLRTLKLNNNSIGNKGMVSVFGALEHMSRLVHLNVSSNYFSKWYAQIAIANSLSKLTSLQNIAIGDTFARDRRIIGAIGLLTQLSVLDVSGIHFAHSLKNSFTHSLKRLMLNRTNIKDLNFLKCAPNIEELCADSNEINLKNSGALKEMSNLRTLSLCYNKIASEDELVDMICCLSGLENLRLKGNSFLKNKSIRFWSATRRLRTLDVGMCEIESIHLSSTSLEELHMCGSYCVSGTFWENTHLPNLKVLNLEGAKLNVQLLCKFLKKCRLVVFKIYIEGLGTRQQEAIFKCLDKSRLQKISGQGLCRTTKSLDFVKVKY